jgi:hypothetical protein
MILVTPVTIIVFSYVIYMVGSIPTIATIKRTGYSICTFVRRIEYLNKFSLTYQCPKGA